MFTRITRCRGQPPPWLGLLLVWTVIVYLTWWYLLTMIALMTWTYWRWADGLDLNRIFINPVVKTAHDAWVETEREGNRESEHCANR
jgi:hypothetical protein